MRFPAERSAASTMARRLGASIVMGFSQTTSSPRSRPATMYSACVKSGDVTIRTSGSVSASIVSNDSGAKCRMAAATAEFPGHPVVERHAPLVGVEEGDHLTEVGVRRQQGPQIHLRAPARPDDGVAASGVRHFSPVVAMPLMR